MRPSTAEIDIVLARAGLFPHKELQRRTNDELADLVIGLITDLITDLIADLIASKSVRQARRFERYRSGAR